MTVLMNTVIMLKEEVTVAAAVHHSLCSLLISLVPLSQRTLKTTKVTVVIIQTISTALILDLSLQM